LKYSYFGSPWILILSKYAVPTREVQIRGVLRDRQLRQD
jgi:hypothetical protein